MLRNPNDPNNHLDRLTAVESAMAAEGYAYGGREALSSFKAINGVETEVPIQTKDQIIAKYANKYEVKLVDDKGRPNDQKIVYVFLKNKEVETAFRVNE